MDLILSYLVKYIFLFDIVRSDITRLNFDQIFLEDVSNLIHSVSMIKFQDRLVRIDSYHLSAQHTDVKGMDMRGSVPVQIIHQARITSSFLYQITAQALHPQYQ